MEYHYQPSIAIIISSLNPGGAERVVVNQANYWAARGWQITLVTMTSTMSEPFYTLDPRIRHENVNFGAPASGFFDGITKNFDRHLRLKEAINNSAPECIVSHLHVVNVRTLLATLCARIPVIVVEHGWPGVSKIGCIWNALRNITYRRASLLIAPAQGIIDCFPKRIKDKSRVIPNPVVISGSKKRESDDTLPVGNNIVGMGRMVDVKRFDLLIRAFSMIDVNDKCTLHIVGDGPLRGELENLAHSLGVYQKVKFWGSIMDPWTVFNKADLLVVTSKSEGFPMVILEAMAHGVPVVSFDCPVGPKEIIRDGIDGVLVKHDDLNSLVSGVKDLLENETKRLEFARRATEVTDRFSESKLMGCWEEAIQKCILKDQIVY